MKWHWDTQEKIWLLINWHEKLFRYADTAQRLERKQMKKHSDIENSQNIFKKIRHCFLTEVKSFSAFSILNLT